MKTTVIITKSVVVTEDENTFSLTFTEGVCTDCSSNLPYKKSVGELITRDMYGVSL